MPNLNLEHQLNFWDNLEKCLLFHKYFLFAYRQTKDKMKPNGKLFAVDNYTLKWGVSDGIGLGIAFEVYRHLQTNCCV